VKLLREATTAHQAGRFADAEALYRGVLKIDARQFSVLLMLGILQAQRGNFADAEKLLQEALTLNPADADAQFYYANVLVALERLDEAFAAFGKALSLNPALADAELNRGNILMLRKRFEEALACFDAALQINSNFAQAYSNRTHALGEMERFEEALASSDAALKINSKNAEFHASHANILQRMGRYAEALSSLSTALSLRPDSAAFHFNRGNILFDLKRFDEAFAAFDKALALEPNFADAHYNEGFARLLLGDTERGWKKYEYRWELPERRGSKRNFSQPVWLGDDPLADKTILIHAEQGFGDTIMACRYVSMVAALGARVILEVQPALLQLMKGLDGVSTLIARGEPIPPFDVHCPIMSLPMAFRSRPETIPNTVPYLRVPKEKIDQWRSRLGDSGFKIGFAWAGNPTFKKDRDRSITLKNILPICSVADAKYFSIQKDLRDNDAEILRANPGITQLANELYDFQDTAAAMMCLDLIISSDTAVVNLAGALGRPVWILLSFIPDWRWLLERADSPWYPTARLFRQSKNGEWGSVITDVRAELERLKIEQQAAAR
jgi:tetratricopeptide (TPR) repeat protein